MFNLEDWDKSKERYMAFWCGEIVDRCCISITSPKEKPVAFKDQPRKAKDFEEQWLSNEYRMEQFKYKCLNTFYGGDAFPNFWNDLGPGILPAIIGAPYVLAGDTVWFDRFPIINDWSQKPKIELDEKNEMWKKVWDMTHYFCENSCNDYVVGLTELGSPMEVAASLRGNNNLLYDFYDNPDEVKSLIEEIGSMMISCYNKLYALIREHQEGVATWMNIWCPERYYILQCDFSALMSPDMFEEFAKPTLARLANSLGRAIYHLDGPNAIKHLDHLLEIENLTGIQWTPGAGNSNVCDERWYPLYKKIQDKGKNLVILGADADRVEKLMENISLKGVYIQTYCESEEDAKELLKKVEKKRFY